MEEKEKDTLETVVEPTVDGSTSPVVDTTQEENQDEDVTVDNNTEIDHELISTDVPMDEPVEDPTLATTDEIIPAPIDVPAEQTVTNDPAIIPLEPVVPEDPGLEAGCEGECNTAECGTEPCATPNITVANFFGTLQECVTIVWRFHLKTRKHHIHNDLNDFYQAALDKVDNIIEQYQGICGIIEDPFTNCVVGEGKDEISYLQELKSFIENNKCILGDHSEINSSIDEFLGLIDSTLYKLTSFTESAVKSFEEFVYEDYEQ